MKAYYRGAHLTRLVDWRRPAEPKHWGGHGSRGLPMTRPRVGLGSHRPLPKDLVDHPTPQYHLYPPLWYRYLATLNSGLQNPRFQCLITSGRLCDFVGPNGRVSPPLLRTSFGFLEWYPTTQLSARVSWDFGRIFTSSRHWIAFVVGEGESVRRSLSLIYASLT